MVTRFLVSLLSIIPLAGTLVRPVPPPRPITLASPNRQSTGTDSLKVRLAQFGKAYRAGNLQEAAALAQRGYQEAIEAHEPKRAALFLNNLGGCQFALHQYQQAIKTFLAGRRLVEPFGDHATLGRIEFNISSLYVQLGQNDAAFDAAERAIVLLSGQERVKVLIHMATLRAAQNRLPQALALFGQGIAAADRANDLQMYTLGWSDLGELYLIRKQFPQAERALLEAYRIRKLNRMRGLESSYRYLGLLRLEQGDLRAAYALLDRAVALCRQPGGMVPTWELYYARARVRLQQHQAEAALDDLRIAARLARNWRREAPSDDASRVAAENSVQKVHSALVEAGNQVYFETHRAELAQETFESAEANRASSLAALLAEPRDWRHNLPPAYWETLQRLQSAEMEMLRATEGSAGSARPVAERIRRLQGALNQWESQAGSNSDRGIPDLLQQLRRSLRPDAVFFTFYLASPDSYVWAVSRQRFALYRLPAGPRIAALVQRFNSVVRAGSPDAAATGSEIFRLLFGQIDPVFMKKPRWIMALDAQLFEFPFAALVVRTRDGVPEFLAERHSLQFASGAAMFATAPAARGSAGPFVAVADAVYNRADPRWTGVRPSSFFGFQLAGAGDSGPDGDLHLARLAGSAQEAAASAAAWGGPQAPVLLEGPSATRDRLQRELDRHPAVLHFATHVLPSRRGTRSGLIVLSLNPNGRHEVLSPVEIATWNLDGALVSLSGCSSGSADALPATGLMGLTRACQAAGARAVVASRWPTPDDTGAFFLSFYRFLRADPQAGPATALQHAQVDMLRSGTWRSNPGYWSAYFVTGNEQ